MTKEHAKVNRVARGARALAVAAFILAAAGRASADFCSNCILNSGAPQVAQFNVSNGVVRGQLAVGTLVLSSFSGNSVTADVFTGSGTFLTNLNASQLLLGTVPSARVTGAYTGVTGVGTLTSGTWQATPLGTQYGGTGQNFSTVGAGAIIYASGTGAFTTLPSPAGVRVLETAGSGAAPVWISSPALTGQNFSAVPLAALNSGTLPAGISVTDASLVSISASKVSGNISGGAATLTVPLPVSNLAGGTLPTSNAASSVTATGTPTGVFGGPTTLAQVTVGSDGRTYNVAQFNLVVAPSQVTAGALPAGVTLPAAQVTAGSLPNNVIASSIAASGVVPGSYGDLMRTVTAVVGSDGRLASLTQQLIGINPTQINAGTLPAGVAVPATSIAAGTMATNVVASSVAASGVVPGTYGGPTSVSQLTIGRDGRVTSASQFMLPSFSSNVAATNVDNNWSHAQTSQSSWTILAGLSAQGVVSTTFSGDGSAVTNLNPANIGPGTYGSITSSSLITGTTIAATQALVVHKSTLQPAAIALVLEDTPTPDNTSFPGNGNITLKASDQTSGNAWGGGIRMTAGIGGGFNPSGDVDLRGGAQGASTTGGSVLLSGGAGSGSGGGAVQVGGGAGATGGYVRIIGGAGSGDVDIRGGTILKRIIFNLTSYMVDKRLGLNVSPSVAALEVNGLDADAYSLVARNESGNTLLTISTGGMLTSVSSVTASAFFGNGSGLTGVTASDATKVAKAGDTMTGALNMTNVPVTLTGVAGNVTSASSVTASGFFGNGAGLTGVTGATDATKVLKAGDTMTGALNMTNVAVILTGSAGNISGASSVTASGFYAQAVAVATGTFTANNEKLRVLGSGRFEGTGNNNNIQRPLTIARQRLDATAPGAGFGAMLNWNLEGAVDGSADNAGDAGGIRVFWELPQTNSSSDQDASMTFFTMINTTATQRMIITSTGNVGIAATNPVTRLEINGDMQVGSGVTKSTFNTLGQLFMASGASVTLTGANGVINAASSVTASGFFGNGLGLTGLVLKTGDTMTGALTMSNAAVTLTGSGGNVVGSSSVTASGFFGTSLSLASGGSLNVGGQNSFTLPTTFSSSVTVNNNILSNSSVTASGFFGTALTITSGPEVHTGAGGTITTASSVTASGFFGNGSGLTGVTASDATKVAKAGDTMTGALNMTNVPVTLTGVAGNVTSASSVTASGFFGISAILSGDAFSVGASTFVVAGGRVGVGTASPTTDLHVVQTTSAAGIREDHYSDDAVGSAIIGRKARGTSGAPAAVLASDRFMTVGGLGYDGAFPSSSTANIQFQAAENFGAAAHGSDILFNTVANGTTTITERMRIKQDGTVLSYSSVTASGFFGDGSNLTDIESSSYTVINNTTFTNTTFNACISSATISIKSGSKIAVTFNGAMNNTAALATTAVTVLVDGAFTVTYGTAAITEFGTDTAGTLGTNASSYPISFHQQLYADTFSAGAHTACLAPLVSAGTGSVLTTSAIKSVFGATEDK